MATYRTRTGISVTPGVYTEFGKDVKRPNWRIGNPVVNPRAVDSIKKAYEKLGLDYETATGDPEYVDKAFEQVRNRLKAAGVELGEDASIHDLARAYDKLDDNQRRRYASYSDNSSTATPANAVTETAAAPVVQGGKPKVEPEAAPAIPPRRGAAAPEVTTVGRGNPAPGETNVSLGGRPVSIDNTSAVGALKGQQASVARTAEIQAKREEKAVRNDASSDERRLAQERMATEIALDKNLDALLAARQKRIDANWDKRYKDRAFRNSDDWKNLGRLREGEKMLSQDEYNKRVGALAARADALYGGDAEGRAGFGTDRLVKLLNMTGGFKKGKDGNWGGNFTPAQLDALEKRLTEFEDGAARNRDMARAVSASNRRQTADATRMQYGLDGFSDDEVLEFKKVRDRKLQAAALQTLKSIGDPKDADSLQKFDDAWRDLYRTGADLSGAFKRATGTEETRDAYMNALADITGDDVNQKRENFRRQTIVNQLLSEAAGTTGRQPVQQAPAGSQVAPVAPTAASEPVQPAEQPAVQVATSGILPRRKKDEQLVQAAVKGGIAPLAPRIRR